jgi:pyridoxal phosphate enzyme (YggS family)
LNEPAVAQRLKQIRQHIAGRATRGPVALCAVTKGFGAEAVEIAQRLGCDAVGENYAQEAISKMAAVGSIRPPVHFIGRLQSNKIRLLVGVVDVWQSIDRASLIDELVKRAPGAQVYVQVNATGEPDKGGCAVGDAARLVAQAQAAGLVVQGLMTVGPTESDAAHTTAAFATVRALADELELVGCSMGMSNDLDLALAAGSTLVRLGTALFGERP